MTDRPGRQISPALFALVVALIGLNIRAGLGSVPPLLPEIRADLGLTNTGAGLITSLAVLMIGLFAPLGQRLGARIGAEAATAWCLALLALAHLARLVPAGPVMLYATTMATGAAMGAASSMVPALIGAHARRSRGLVMGIYTTGMALGIAAAAALAVPLDHLLGGWRESLAAWGAFAAVAAVAWTFAVVRVRSAQRSVVTPQSAAGLPWSSRTARLVTLFFASQMVVGYGCMAWIAPFYVDLGRSPSEAAALFVLFQVVQLASMLLLPALTDLTRDRRPLLAGCSTCVCVGLVMLVLAPVTLAVPAVAMAGLGAGGGATLGLVLMVDTTTSVLDGGRLTAMALLVGNAVGALAPLALGAVKDVTDSFVPGLVGLAVIAGGTLLVVRSLVPGLHIEDARSPAALRGSARPDR